jgi:hypothetical protein
MTSHCDKSDVAKNHPIWRYVFNDEDGKVISGSIQCDISGVQLALQKFIEWL